MGYLVLLSRRRHRAACVRVSLTSLASAAAAGCARGLRTSQCLHDPGTGKGPRHPLTEETTPCVTQVNRNRGCLGGQAQDLPPGPPGFGRRRGRRAGAGGHRWGAAGIGRPCEATGRRGLFGNQDRLQSLEHALDAAGLAPAAGPWARLRSGWYQNLDRTGRENAAEPTPACCNKPPVAGHRSRML